MQQRHSAHWRPRPVQVRAGGKMGAQLYTCDHIEALLSLRLRLYLGSQRVDVELPFYVVLRLIKQWRSNQQEVGVAI